MATDSTVRLTIRIDIPDSTAQGTEIDLAVPQNSCIAEILEEVLTLAGAPRISKPWQATTAAGVLIDAAEPLAQTPLTHGSTLVLSPHHEVEPPVVKDAAQSLAEQPNSASLTGLMAVAVAIGMGLVFCCMFSPIAAHIPLGFRFGFIAALAFGIMVQLRNKQADFGRIDVASLSLLSLISISCTCLASVSFIMPGPRAADHQITSWVGLVTALCGAVALLACHALGNPPARFSVSCASVLAIAALSSTVLFLTVTPSRIAAAICAIAIITVALSPWLSIRCAGLKVPQLPSPGQDLHIADVPLDGPLDSPDDRAQHAIALLDGILMGTAICAVPAMLILGVRGDGYTACLCLASAGAVLTHSVRHRSLMALWSLWLWGMSALAGLGICLAHAHHNIGLFCITSIVAIACCSSPLWAHHIHKLQPTTLNWLEKFESLAVAATIPLAAHILGIFALIRGLG